MVGPLGLRVQVILILFLNTCLSARLHIFLLIFSSSTPSFGGLVPENAWCTSGLLRLTIFFFFFFYCLRTQGPIRDRPPLSPHAYFRQWWNLLEPNLENGRSRVQVLSTLTEISFHLVYTILNCNTVASTRSFSVFWVRHTWFYFLSKLGPVVVYGYRPCPLLLLVHFSEKLAKGVVSSLRTVRQRTV